MTRPRQAGSNGVPAMGATDASMTTLTVWHYNTAMGASAGEIRLRDLEAQGSLTVIDAITLVWMPHTPRPRVGRFNSRTGRGARRGAVLGALAGALVLAPVAGAAAGAGLGALAGRARQTGIDESFLRQIEQRLVPGTSALLVLSRDADLEAVAPFLERGRTRGDVTLMHAVLPEGAPRALQALLDAEPSLSAEAPDPAEPPSAQSPLPTPRGAPPAPPPPPHQEKP